MAAGAIERKEGEGGEGHHPALWVRLEGHILAPPSPPSVTVGLGFVKKHIRQQQRTWIVMIFNCNGEECH